MRDRDSVMAEARAFIKSRIILTAAELDLFTRIHRAPATLEELAGEKKLDPKGAARLLDCLAAFGFLEKTDGVYRVSEAGKMLSSRDPESVLPMVLHFNHLWDNWSGLTETVIQGSNPAKAHMTERGEDNLRSFIGAMHVIGRGLALAVADSYDLAPFRKMLDIGGASGTYTMAFLRKNPSLRAVIFDRENVVPLADEKLREEGLRDRVELAAGDFYKDELPGGCDLALLSAIIHQNSSAENLDLYRKIHRALAPGGVLLVRDHIMEESRTSPVSGAVFALNMLVNTRGGDTYTMEEVRTSLESAGFTDVKWVRKTPDMDNLVEARKPA
ncbi:MAG: methyltransferase [Syntrophobacteraceae bacterium]